MKRLEARSCRPRPSRSPRPTSPPTAALVKGYIGPESLGEGSASGIRFLVDPRVVTGTPWVTGANAPGHHVFGLVAGRDFTPDGVIDVADVVPGDPCPTCGSPIEIARGIEIGHIFQLGRKYAEALGLTVLTARRQTGRRHDGVVRHRRVPGGGGDRRDDARRVRAVLAARGGPGRRARRDRRQARRRAVAGRRGTGRPSSRRPGCACCSTTATRSRPA